jgi:hypothetical protein
VVKLPAREGFRVEFARLVNVTFSSEMVDNDRRAYWLEVIEPIWDGLAKSWDASGPVSELDWQPIIFNALAPCVGPAQWHLPRIAAQKKAKAEKARKNAQDFREKSKAEWMQKNGYEEAKPVVNTKAFWQGQSFGPASEVRRIDPLTGDVVEVIRQHDK